MPLILILLVVLFGGSGYYMGPGVGYYGGGGISLILALVVIYLLFGRGRDESNHSTMLVTTTHGPDHRVRLPLHLIAWDDRTHIELQE